MAHSFCDGYVGRYIDSRPSKNSWYALSMFVVSGGGNLSTDSPVRRQERFESALRKPQRFTGSLWAGTLSVSVSGVLRWGRCCDSGNLPRTCLCPAVGYPGRNLRSQVWVGADFPLVRGETGCFLWLLKQSKVVGCCPEVQALTFRGCFVVAPVDMLALEVAKIQTWGNSRAWRFVDVNNLISCDVHAQPLSL